MADKFCMHEALHMTSFLCRAIDEELLQNPAITENGRWLMMARRAEESLAALYQAIGSKHLVEDEDHSGVCEGPTATPSVEAVHSPQSSPPDAHSDTPEVPRGTCEGMSDFGDRAPNRSPD